MIKLYTNIQSLHRSTKNVGWDSFYNDFIAKQPEQKKLGSDTMGG
jgi:hypothetical protein